jgi:hypothetical protein
MSRAAVLLLWLLCSLSGCGGGNDRCGAVVLAPHNCTQTGCIGESWSSDKVAFGGTCDKGEDCQSGLCATDIDGTKYCTQTCDVAATTAACPKNAGCFGAKGGLTVCGPPGSGGGPVCP